MDVEELEARLAGQAGSVLLVEDDRPLAAVLVRLLSGAGYAVDTAFDGQRGLHLALSRPYTLMVLDRTLPAIEGLDLLARIRSSGVTAPVLVLSALSSARDRVQGLDAGAEDYLTKPFDTGELLARLRALRRRHAETSCDLTLPFGRLEVAGHQVVRPDGGTVTLTTRECDLLETLARRPHQVFSQTELMDRAFPEAVDDGLVGVYVHHLRRKLGARAIETVRGLGYRLGRG
ncbi:response regulator transcription factor [Humibacillus sp. DSM 29435]|uniref:response regulator transcription factor n=1 Tax=Humibacillus sp. DSM 29435 TaxID=1869167 RepID=UPI001586AAAE|nr:response regulator transcription factor [Humibacillus sp. DSM 29435]